MGTLVRHRHAMWTAIGHRTEREIAEHDPRYRKWIRPRLASGETVGFVAEDADHGVLGSGVVWFRPDQPRPMIRFLSTPYILSMFTEPDARGRGVASGVVRSLLRECRARGYPSAVLHASLEGRSVYSRLGFERTWEMRIWLDPALRRRRQAWARADARRSRTNSKKGRKRLDRGRSEP